jgi:hypothetical protein
MLKLLILLPLMLVGGALALGLVLPMLALLPIALALGAGVLAFMLAFAALGLCVRLIAGILVGAGVLFIGALGFGALFVGGAAVLIVGFALAHLLLPVLLILGVICLIRSALRRVPALPGPPTPV